MSKTKDLNIFQIVTMAVFLVIGAIGIVMFATNKVGSGSNSYTAIVWGVLPKTTIDASLESFSIQGIDPKFKYTEFPEDGFEQEILQAIAEGRGPDAIVFPDTMYFGEMNKLVTIPTETISAKVFSDTYIDSAEKFTVQGGVKAFPLVIDPLVMYYNKDMFTSAGILTPPKSWKEVSDTVDKISRKRDDGVIERASVALGEYSNISHAKEILYTLLTQADIRVSFYDDDIGLYSSGLTRSTNAENAVGASSASDRTASVISFYTNFANPLSPNYTWNRSFSSSRDAFLSQKLAIYFGPGSEIQYLLSRNPNLNFGIAPVPQENRDVKAVHGKSYLLGFLVTSQNVAKAYPEVSKYFTGDIMIQGLADAMQIAPAKRNLLVSAKSAKDNADLENIYESAAYASTWTDPKVDSSDDIFKTLIESITSGKQDISESIQDAVDRINRLYGSR